MTTVNIILSVPSETGPVPAVGKVEFHPTARYEYAGDVVLPAPFTVELDVNGEAVVELDPTGIYFAWRVREFMHGGANYYVSVPESATPVSLEDLEVINPETLEPEVQFAAWSDLEVRVEDLEAGIIIPTAVNSLQYNTATLETANVAGKTAWNDADGTLDLRLKDGDVTLQLGQEQVVRVVNKSGVTLPEGAAVYVVGAFYQRLSVALASSNSESLSSSTIGVVTHSGGIANNAQGYVTLSGLVRGLNTSAYTEGATLWLNTVAGTYSTTRPIAPAHAVRIGWVIVSGVNGSIMVSVANPYELEELHNVKITNPQEGDHLVYRSGLWVNEQPV